ncbi:DUF4232 domain-containing protein [Amycolatopsis rhabdoformis]|uniref:DUF4232 domain-containing protein n=1 Tax=Amycolatopsis rhabdoformis TaxID=1448059 RepID=A0ABZ1HU35_9PSEU|nr:DUF4232 domain-containing protein [Amycolatopsis rhabdoformis]WSE25948.1 DUF4232 domain-containing protein [Amycolatopsis rhabdoformis]
MPEPQPPVPSRVVTSGEVPEPALVVSAGVVEAALGHRATVLTLTNNDTKSHTLDGYPVVRVLGGDGKPLEVKVSHGISYFSQDPGPKRLELKPHEKLLSVVSWSGTVTSGDKVTGEAVAVVAAPGEVEQTVPLETDLGTTGEIIVTAWLKDLPK